MASHSILCVGDSGAGKTSLIASLVARCQREGGKIVRVISSDPGGWDSVVYLEEAGLIDCWNVTTHLYPFETLQYAAKGHWPKDKCDPSSPLVPPTPETWKKVGAVCFDSMTGKGNWLLDALTIRGAKGEKIGENAPSRFRDGQTDFANANPTYYGIAQRRVMDAVDASKELPGYVYWTALQMRATDKDTNVPIFGPELVGSAKTGDIPRWFGNTLGLVEWPIAKDKKERRLYLTTYFDERNPTVPHICKAGGIPAVVAAKTSPYLVLDPTKERWGLDEYIDLVEKAKKDAASLMTRAPALVGK